MRERLLELDPRFNNEQDLKNILEDNIERVLGNSPPEIAVSPKGKFLGVSGDAYRLWEAKKAGISSSKGLGQGTATASLDHDVSSGAAGVLNSDRESHNFNTSEFRWAWIWIIGAILLLAVAGRMLVKLLPK